MDSNSKMRKGSMKGKLVMAFYRASKPPTTTTTTKAVKTPAATSGQKTSLIMNQQEKVVKPQTKHVSYQVMQETKGRKYDHHVFENHNNPYYGHVVVDEGVDVKASVYISCVQERFKLEHVNNEQLVHPAS